MVPLAGQRLVLLGQLAADPLLLALLLPELELVAPLLLPPLRTVPEEAVPLPFVHPIAPGEQGGL